MAGRDGKTDARLDFIAEDESEQQIGAADAPQFGDTGVLPPQPGADLTIWDAIGTAGAIDTAKPLASPITDFYLTNPIARASATMAECSRIFVRGETQMAAE